MPYPPFYLPCFVLYADYYDPIEIPDDPVYLDNIANPAELYQGVWPQAARLRATGELLNCVVTITCPVVAIHGDYDPHPSEGVQQPLAANVKDFRMIILKQCGHTPVVNGTPWRSLTRYLSRSFQQYNGI